MVKKYKILLLLMLLQGFSYAVDKPSFDGLLTVPFAKKAVVVDGQVGKEEWANAVSFSGLRMNVDGRKYLARPDRTTAYIMYDNDFLYIAWKCNHFNANSVKRKTELRRDATYWNDESIEIYIYPENNRDSVYQFVITSDGGIYDSHNRKLEWNGNFVCKTSEVNDSWQGEMAIKFSELGTVMPQFGQKWLFNFCRNLWQESHELLSWAGLYQDSGTLVFDPNAPAVQVVTLGKGVIAPNDIDFTVKNNCKVKSTYDLLVERVINGKTVGRAAGQSQPAGPGKTVSLGTQYAPDSKLPFNLRVSISDKRTKKVLYKQDYPLMGQYPLIVMLDPSYVRSKVAIDGDITGIQAAGEKTAEVIVYCEKSDKPFSRVVLEKVPENFSTKLDLPKEKQICKIEVNLKDKSGKLIATNTQPLEIIPAPEGIGCNIGKSDKVPTPWTPMEVDGSTVKCWGRDYVFAGYPWPEKIIAIGSELLASPIDMELQVGGRDIEFTPAAVKIKEADDTKVVVESKCKSGLINIASTTTVEYDGMMLLDMVFSPSKALKVDKLTFSIPLKYEDAKYLLRTNMVLHESGEVIVGKPGWKWKAPFYPTIWLGGDNRGLCWFADSDEGWKPYDRPDTLEVIRKGDNVIIKLNVIANSKLDKPLRLVMGLQATPVKPMNPNRHKWHMIHCSGGPYGEIPDDKPAYTDLIMGSLTPEKIAEMGYTHFVFHSYWARNFGGFEAYRPEEFKQTVKKLHDAGMKAMVYYSPGSLSGLDEIFKKYGRKDWKRTPTGSFGKGSTRRKGQWGETMCCCPEETRDIFMYNIKKVFDDYDIDGLYYDTVIAPCNNHLHGCGYEAAGQSSKKYRAGGGILGIAADDTSGEVSGNRRVTYNILAKRDLFKRLYTFVKEMKKDTLISHHTSNFMVVPLTSFSDIYWNGEHIQTLPDDWYPTCEVFRSQFVGKPFGVPSEFLRVDKWKEGDPWEMFAFTMIHDVPSRPVTPPWGGKFIKPMAQVWKILDDFNVTDSTWHPYYENTDEIKLSKSGADAKTSYYLNNQKDAVLVIVSDLTAGKGTRRVTMTLNREKIGLKSGKLECVNMLTGEKYEVDDSEVEFRLGYRKPVILKIFVAPN